MYWPGLNCIYVEKAKGIRISTFFSWPSKETNISFGPLGIDTIAKHLLSDEEAAAYADSIIWEPTKDKLPQLSQT